jgi:hypothetical protein
MIMLGDVPSAQTEARFHGLCREQETGKPIFKMRYERQVGWPSTCSISATAVV